MNRQTNKLLTFLKGYWPSVLTLAVVLYATLCSNPLGDQEMPAIPHLDKLIHAIMMGGLFGAIVFDKQRANKSKRVSRKFLNILTVAIMGFCIIDEIAQTEMGIGRSGDILDIVADWSGIAIAYFTAPPIVRKVLGLS
ncbi:MAG: VanZ family protein [Muribaculaceae bacterium]|nr:VanZ family protein [Muribaculaceae bacterium]